MGVYYLYVSNKEYPDVAPLADELAGDEHVVRFRNPNYFGDSHEVLRADKVYVYGKHSKVLQACQEHDVECVHLAYDGRRVKAGQEPKNPSMQWRKDELVTFAEANGLDSSGTKRDILDRINEANYS